MPLTVLSDNDVRDLLENLTREELESLQKSLVEGLHEYSTGNQTTASCARLQPQRTLIGSDKNGTNTLFMPSRGKAGMGVKVVTVPRNPLSPTATDKEVPQTTAQGAITLTDPSGIPYGFINASEMTAFRTALASSLLLVRRTKVSTITIFGAGRQAYWHLRLALKLRGPTIKHVNLILRRMNVRSRTLVQGLLNLPMTTRQREGWANCKFGAVGYDYAEFARVQKDMLRSADVIFCTVPSTKPLFDEKILTNTEGRKKGRLLVAVGSYRPDMLELPPELLHQAVKTHGSGHHFHKHAEEGGCVLVDTVKGCLREAGEVIQAGLHDKQLVELGEIAMLENMALQEQAVMDDESSNNTSNSNITSPTLTSSPPPLDSLILGADGKSSMFSVYGSASASFDTTGSGAGGSTSRSSSPNRRSSSFSLHSLPRSIFHHRSNSSSSGSSAPFKEKEKDKNKEQEKEDAMSRWLSKGNVIYKSVGLGLMDLVVGADLIALARGKGVGTTVGDF